MKHVFYSLLLAATLAVSCSPAHATAQEANAAGTLHASTSESTSSGARWSRQKAHDWYASQAWPVGSDYLPSNAINQLEMWQADTFDPKRIDLELGWAQQMGMTTMRVYLHDLLWKQDAAGFKERIDTFLTVAARHHIKPIFVLFDSCWDLEPKLGP